MLFGLTHAGETPGIGGMGGDEARAGDRADGVRAPALDGAPAAGFTVEDECRDRRVPA